jgi:lipoprotein-releasing system permease protein
MDAPFELHIAVRYLLARRKQAFISVISLISTLGVTVGVMALVIALALMTGLQQELRNRILGANAHVYVFKHGMSDYRAERGKLLAIPHVTGASPAVNGQGLVSFEGRQQFISIKGIDPALEPEVTDIASAMRSGRLSALQSRPAAGPDDTGGAEVFPGILLGSDLAATVGAVVGDTVTIVTVQGTLTPFGMKPGTHRLRVVGIFNLGLFEFDSTFGFTALDTAMRLFDKDSIDYMQLRVDDIFQSARVARSIPAALGSEYLANDWSEMQRSLFSALWLEKMAISITIGLIVMVAALNIVASLVLLVMEKHRDIAILKTMGASARSVTAIFMAQGLMIGLAGTTVGALAGLVVSRVLDRYKLIQVPVDVYQVSHVPFTVLPRDFAVVVVAALIVCFVATIYPSRQAARLDPAQALRYE